MEAFPGECPHLFEPLVRKRLPREELLKVLLGPKVTREALHGHLRLVQVPTFQHIDLGLNEGSFKLLARVLVLERSQGLA